MRERTLKSLFDKIMWYGIYLFPLIAHCFLLLSFSNNSSTEYVTFSVFMGQLGFEAGAIYNIIYSIFGEYELLDMVADSGMISYANYLVFVTILHVIFDVIVFIPRLFHNFLDTLEKGDIIK